VDNNNYILLYIRAALLRIIMGTVKYIILKLIDIKLLKIVI